MSLVIYMSWLGAPGHLVTAAPPRAFWMSLPMPVKSNVTSESILQVYTLNGLLCRPVITLSSGFFLQQSVCLPTI